MPDLTKRAFLKTVGAGVPTLKLLIQPAAAEADPPAAEKSTPIDLGGHFTASAADFGPRPRARALAPAAAQDSLLRTPGGRQVFRGIPFLLGEADVRAKSWIVLQQEETAWARRSVEIPLGRKAAFLCLAQFCDWDENESPPPSVETVERAGQPLGQAVLLYEDGTSHSFPIRRRFEVNSPSITWGHLPFAAVPHRQHAPRPLTDPLPSGADWGNLQTALWDGAYDGRPMDTRAILWVCALSNPFPDRTVKAVRLEARAAEPLVVCGLTLFHGHESPLRCDRLSLYQIALPSGEDADGWEAAVDLGVVARTYPLPDFEAQAWLASPTAGLAQAAHPTGAARRLGCEISASPEATLTLSNAKTGRQYKFDLGRAAAGAEIEARGGGARVQVVDREKVWIRGRVLDAATRRPTPVRLALRSHDGRYIPPYGHRTDVNRAWFEDYGADIKLADNSYAYVDGEFQVELPAGEVYVEITKGFEYQPVRRRLEIRPGQRELELDISRFADFRSKGWITADSHVHFLSPSTAVLEGQAEGVNLVNLLAAQWGDLFTNVGDLSYGPLTSKDGETVVWVGTENRQHLLGHIALLGGHGFPVYPMSAGGPSESYLGDPLWTSLSEWADRCRQREGLVVAVHFPYPTAELAADIVMGKIDALEMWPTAMGEQFNNLRFLDWYRYLNCGYRLPAVAGTDKMGGWIAVGAHRAYAYLGQDEFSFANWAKAVRSGNTFMTSGPLLLFQADGRMPGGEIALSSGGGTVEVRAEAKSIYPFHRVDIVFNGSVIASREDNAGAREMTLNERVRVPGAGWLAARCASRLTSDNTRISAHTSPVYVKVAGQDVFSQTSAAYMLTLIEGAETWAKTLAARPDPETFARALKIFADARERLHRRLHEHGIQHKGGAL